MPEAAASTSDRRVRALYEELGPAVYRRCLRLLGNPDAARDATQEVFIKLVHNLAALEGRETLLPWMYRVSTNHCLNLRRAASLRGDDRELDDSQVAAAVSPDERAHRLLAKAILSRFDAATQAVAVGVRVDGMDYAEVANVLGVSARTVSKKLVRFLASAREFLDDGASDVGARGAVGEA